MGLDTIFEKIKLAKSEAAQGHYAAATKQVALAIADAADLAGALGFKSEPGSEAKCEEIKKCCEEIKADCDAPKASNDPVGKLGDGVLLKVLLDAFLKFLPLII